MLVWCCHCGSNFPPGWIYGRSSLYFNMFFLDSFRTTTIIEWTLVWCWPIALRCLNSENNIRKMYTVGVFLNQVSQRKQLKSKWTHWSLSQSHSHSRLDYKLLLLQIPLLSSLPHFTLHHLYQRRATTFWCRSEFKLRIWELGRGLNADQRREDESLATWSSRY